MGLAFAGAGTARSLPQGLGGARVMPSKQAFYAAMRSGPAYLAAAFAFTKHWMSTDRFAFASNHLNAEFNAQSYGGRLEGGYRFGTPYGGIAPYGAVHAQNFRTPDFSEVDVNNGGFALAFLGRNATDTRSRTRGAFRSGAGGLFQRRAGTTRTARLGHDWVSDAALTTVFQALPGAEFRHQGRAPREGCGSRLGGGELRLTTGITLLAKLDGEFSSHAQAYAATGTLRWAW